MSVLVWVWPSLWLSRSALQLQSALTVGVKVDVAVAVGVGVMVRLGVGVQDRTLAAAGDSGTLEPHDYTRPHRQNSRRFEQCCC